MGVWLEVVHKGSSQPRGVDLPFELDVSKYCRRSRVPIVDFLGLGREKEGS